MPFDPMQGFEVGQKIGASKKSSLNRTSDYMSDLFQTRDKASNTDKLGNALTLATYKNTLDMPNQKANRASKEQAAQDRKTAANDKSWEKIVRNTDPSLASSRSTLGMAANANLRADRAMVTLNNPKMTYQDAQNVVADIAGIYAGGAPSDMGMSHSQYETVQSRLANLQQFLSGNPGDAVAPDIKEHIKGVVKDLKSVNNDALKNHFKYQELMNRDVIGSHQDEWDQMKRSVIPEDQSPMNPLQQSASKNSLLSMPQEVQNEQNKLVADHGKFKLMEDAQGNKARVYDDGFIEEIE